MKARGNRSRVIVITKVGSPMGKGKEGLKASYIAEAVEASLKRLQTDAIDLYLSHWPDMATPVEETLGAYQRLIEQGKIRWCGASNLSAKLLEAALAASKAKGLPRYEVLQPEYNLADRHEFEGGLADLCQREEIGVITYFSLAKGFLTGKYRSEADLSKSPRGDGVKAYLNPRGFRILDALEAVAASHKAKPAEVALAWVMARPGVTAPIASATSIEQTDSLVRATELALTEADMDALNTASARLRRMQRFGRRSISKSLGMADSEPHRSRRRSAPCKAEADEANDHHGPRRRLRDNGRHKRDIRHVQKTLALALIATRSCSLRPPLSPAWATNSRSCSSNPRRHSGRDCHPAMR